MSGWFANIPIALADMIGAAKFQHELMAHLVHFYKSKCATQKELIERLRKEVETLKVLSLAQIAHFLIRNSPRRIS